MDEKKRAELLDEFRAAARDTITEWLNRWQAEDGANLRLRHYEDGTAEIEREDDVSIETFRLRFDVAAVDATKPNEPYGFILPRPWNLVPAGWFVQVPNGEWYEVTGTRLVSDGKQEVSMRSPAGKVGTFPRNPGDVVKVRRGTHTKELSDAIEALTGAFGAEILEDTPPWDV